VAKETAKKTIGTRRLFMTKKKVATASQAKQNITSTNVADTLRIAKLTAQVDEQTTEIKELKRALKSQNDILENKLKVESILNIKTMSDYKDAELEALSIEDLQTLETALSRGKGIDSSRVAYKSIRAGDTADQAGQLTVGSLYGKSRKEILESEGEF
jgi:hypothetical protein